MLYQLGYREVFRKKVINCTMLKIHDLSSRMFTFECALYFLGQVFPLNNRCLFLQQTKVTIRLIFYFLSFTSHRQ